MLFLLSEARILEVLRELGLLATRSLEICAGSAHWSTGMNNIIGLDTEKHDITTSVLASCVAWKKLAFQSSLSCMQIVLGLQ